MNRGISAAEHGDIRGFLAGHARPQEESFIANQVQPVLDNGVVGAPKLTGV